MNTLLSMDYLLGKIRIQGGAYGASSSISPNGMVLYYSYRDPNLTETLAVYKKAHEFIASVEMDEATLLRYKIGTISSIDKPMTASMRGERAAMNFLSGLTYERRCQFRHEILKTRVEDIQKHAIMLESIARRGYHSVLGNEKKIEATKRSFRGLVNILSD